MALGPSHILSFIMGIFQLLFCFVVPALVTLFIAYLIDKQRKDFLPKSIRVISWVISVIAFVIAALIITAEIENDGLDSFAVFLIPPVIYLVLFFCIQQFGQKNKNDVEK